MLSGVLGRLTTRRIRRPKTTLFTVILECLEGMHGVGIWQVHGSNINEARSRWVWQDDALDRFPQILQESLRSDIIETDLMPVHGARGVWCMSLISPTNEYIGLLTIVETAM